MSSKRACFTKDYSVTDAPFFVGLFGDPIAQSPSPALHNAAYQRAKLPFVYGTFPMCARDTRLILPCMRLLDIVGANITVPHKVTLMRYLDRVDSHAARIGAVNTIVRRGHRFVGYNTDAQGFWNALFIS